MEVLAELDSGGAVCVLGFELGGDDAVQVVGHVASGVKGLDFKLGRTAEVLAKEEPHDSVREGGLAGGVVAVDAHVLALGLYSELLYALPVLEGERVE